MNKISILTITRNRTGHLRNLLRGLARSSRLPDECIVVHMNEAAEAFGNWPFPCHHHTCHNPDVLLPLAQARNFAAAQATGDILLFLDVDCIPAENMVAAYEKACEELPDVITMGAVRYLQQPIESDWSESLLMSQSKPHPKRNISPVAPLILEPVYGLFWSLSFALRKKLFKQLEGFSSCYPGYGAEDTDFAWKARAADVPLFWAPEALSFHQFHSSQVPPWNNFESIVCNARIFYERWGEWPMGGWLKVFEEEGYLAWSMEGDRIEIIRLPGSEDVEALEQIL